MDKRIIRVFPTRTRATPDDSLVAVDCAPRFFDEADEVHISVLFTWDLKKTEKLEKEWKAVAPVFVGGPATGSPGESFVPGKYVKHGYVITSRGCPNRCWFCSVWRREGDRVREIEIQSGSNVLDDNLLACSKSHIKNVFGMLREQEEPCEFSGGWEASRLEDWHIELLKTIRLHQVWFAYDEDADLEPLIRAGRMLKQHGINYTKTGNVSHKVRCYCLIGWPKDTAEAADKRLRTAYENGFLPMAMLYRDKDGQASQEWNRFQRAWARPASINQMCRNRTEAQYG